MAVLAAAAVAYANVWEGSGIALLRVVPLVPLTPEALPIVVPVTLAARGYDSGPSRVPADGCGFPVLGLVGRLQRSGCFGALYGLQAPLRTD